MPRNGPFDAEERTLDVDAVHLVELLRRHLLDDLADVDAGVVHEDVEAARLLLDLSEHAAPVVLAGHVELGESRLLSVLLSLFAAAAPSFSSTSAM
jgi:hypothetical protein